VGLGLTGPGVPAGANCNVGLIGASITDPLFVTTSRGRYRVGSASPAVDSACAYLGAPSADLDECPRPYGSNDDIGSFEYTAGTCP